MSGHRVGTAEVEGALVSDASVDEAAVCGYSHAPPTPLAPSLPPAPTRMHACLMDKAVLHFLYACLLACCCHLTAACLLVLGSGDSSVATCYLYHDWEDSIWLQRGWHDQQASKHPALHPVTHSGAKTDALKGSCCLDSGRSQCALAHSSPYHTFWG